MKGDRDLCGLALSGGGIRSATFGLGVLQALAREGLLAGFDYLSTVSGGGYIGGFWSAWRSRPRRQQAPGQSPGPTFPEPDGPEVEHLRQFSNFLQPRLHLVSFETGRLLAAVVAGLVPSLLATLGVLSGFLLLWLGMTWVLMEPAPLPAALAFAGLVVGGHLLYGWAWRGWAEGEDEIEAERRVYLLWLLLSTAAGATLWWLLSRLVPLPLELRLGPVPAASFGAAYPAALLLPTAALLLPTLFLVVVRALLSRLARTVVRRRTWHGTIDVVVSRNLYMVAAWAVLAFLWLGGLVLAADGVEGLAAALSASGLGGGAFAWLRRILDKRPKQPSGQALRSSLGSFGLQVLAYLTLAAAVLAVAAILAKVYGVFGLPGLGWAALGALALMLLPIFFDPQEVGFHSFYRARLARAYLGASLEKCARATKECRDDDMALSALAEGRPQHLICAAANSLSGDPIASLHRGAESAVLMREGIQVGNLSRPWAASGPGPPTLAAAMTASAAAFNSHMGAQSMRYGQAVTFLMTALNLRLGLWVENPRSERRARTPLPLFYRELFGLSSLDAPRLHLSDGAHFENLGLYELARRRCRYIVVCDCGSDPEYAFDDLGGAIRKIRTDLGAEITIDTSPLRPGEDGKARQAFVMGDIEYRGGLSGFVLLLKPTLSGGEPMDIAQYARRNEAFPQEPTLDQFYNEAQWEAYRKLGEHTMSAAIRRLQAGLSKSKDPELRLRWAFTRGRYAVNPRAEVDPGLAERLEGRWRELESELAHTEGARHLAEQVLMGELGKSTPPAADDLLASVEIVRRALHLMETVHRVYDLNRPWMSPEHFGWLNRMGRWAYADSFRFWWPWLSTLHSHSLARCLGFWFGIDSLRDTEGIVRPMDGRGPGYTARQWRAFREPDPRKACLGFFLPMGGGREMAVALAQLEIDPGKSATCHFEDFYVPAGLWGIGSSEKFLGKLRAYLSDHFAIEKIRVRFDAQPPPHAAALFTHPTIEHEW